MRFVCPVHYLYRTLAAAQKTPYGVMSSNPIDNRRQQWWFALLWCIRLLSALVIGHVGHVGHVGGSLHFGDSTVRCFFQLCSSYN